MAPHRKKHPEEKVHIQPRVTPHRREILDRYCEMFEVSQGGIIEQWIDRLERDVRSMLGAENWARFLAADIKRPEALELRRRWKGIRRALAPSVYRLLAEGNTAGINKLLQAAATTPEDPTLVAVASGPVKFGDNQQITGVANPPTAGLTGAGPVKFGSTPIAQLVKLDDDDLDD
jgi:hypothetical protein